MSDETKKEMTVSEAGRKGGTKVRDSRGREFYRTIGRLGGNKLKATGHDYSAMGKLGGKAAHAKHPDLAKRAGTKGGARVKEVFAALREKKP